MIIIMSPKATQDDIKRVEERIRMAGLSLHLSQGAERTVIGVLGDVRQLLPDSLQALPGVERVMRILHPFKLASRDFEPNPTVIRLPGGLEIGSSRLVVMAGPCAVEDEETLLETARAVKAAGASVLRGGAFKPRTSPYNFRGLGKEGLELLAKARKETGLPVITEVLSPQDVDLVAEYADILQIGARNMQNFSLLQAVAKVDKPVLLKRGMANSIEEWLMSAEYILSGGNRNVMLCERGIRTFETYTRNTLDLSAVPLVKKLSHLPVLVDPSHGTGSRDLVLPMSKAAVAAGADGLLIEVHPRPERALSDGPQSLMPPAFEALMAEIRPIAEVIGRSA
ncbi:MAG TPA: 3-deoxy-7-phosphoheptulonate synthase [Firmicutes bacterium]|nr:3-deoxy-7-phosphoheptulonate synthase [Bacillota bacterium]